MTTTSTDRQVAKSTSGQPLPTQRVRVEPNDHRPTSRLDEQLSLEMERDRRHHVDHQPLD
ncbi:MAG: hypothetical protein WDZ82_00870 [Candidatus Paceibacterota bacterium]